MDTSQIRFLSASMGTPYDLFLKKEERMELGSALLEISQTTFQETFIFCVEPFLPCTETVGLRWYGVQGTVWGWQELPTPRS